MRSIVGCCMPETPMVLQRTFEAYKIKDDLYASKDRTDILIMSFGDWYDYFPENAPCRCNPMVDSRGCSDEDPYPPKAEAYFDCILKMNSTTRQGWNPCAVMRKEMCDKRIGRNGLNQCSFARDLVMLARWINAHRAELPRHVFWVDPTPVHHPNAEHRISPWHCQVACTILSKVAPWVKVIKTFDVLKDREESHPVMDEYHWCTKSDAYEMYLNTVLSAVVQHVMPDVAISRSNEIGNLTMPKPVDNGTGDR